VPGAKFDDGVLDLIELGAIAPLAMLTTVLPRSIAARTYIIPKARVTTGTSSSSDRTV